MNLKLQFLEKKETIYNKYLEIYDKNLVLTNELSLLTEQCRLQQLTIDSLTLTKEAVGSNISTNDIIETNDIKLITEIDELKSKLTQINNIASEMENNFNLAKSGALSPNKRDRYDSIKISVIEDRFLSKIQNICKC